MISIDPNNTIDAIHTESANQAGGHDEDFTRNKKILPGCCGGGSINVSAQVVKEMAEFIASHGDNLYQFRDSDDSASEQKIQTARFLVESFTCGKCKERVQVPMCRDSAHSPNPLFPYYWYQVHESLQGKTLDSILHGYDIPTELEKKDHFNIKSLLIILKGCLCGELILLEPCSDVNVGVNICHTCGSKMEMLNLWSH